MGQLGLLVLVVGPSGVGKDSLIEAARTRLAGDPRVVFPHREITRPADAGGEAHVEISMNVHRERAAAGAYALSWEAHGLGYGIPAAIEHDLAAGRTVVVNVSRAVIAAARDRFPRVRVLSVTAPMEIVAQRLRARRRESEAAIQGRLARAASYAVAAPDLIELVNDSSLEIGAARFLAALEALTPGSGTAEG